MNNNEKEKSSSRLWKIIIKLSILVIIAIWFSAFIIIIKDRYALKLFLVDSDSMEPALYANDLVVVQGCDINDIKIGDIIVYKHNGDYIIHRVVVKTHSGNEKKLYTKGDNNVNDDTIPIMEHNFIGKQIYQTRLLRFLTLGLNII